MTQFPCGCQLHNDRGVLELFPCCDGCTVRAAIITTVETQFPGAPVVFAAEIEKATGHKVTTDDVLAATAFERN